MHIRARIHRWVVWWFYVGVVCGVIALANIWGRDDLSRGDVRMILTFGVLFWLLGGLLCYAGEGIRIEEHDAPLAHSDIPPPKQPVAWQNEWHAASDFLLPGSRKSLIRRDYSERRRGALR